MNTATATTAIEQHFPELSPSMDLETRRAMLAIVTCELPGKIADSTEKLAEFENRTQRIRETALTTCAKYVAPTELAISEGVAVDFIYLNTVVDTLKDAIVNFSSDGLEREGDELDPELVHMNTELLFLNEFLGVLSANIEWTRLMAQDLARLQELKRLLETKPQPRPQPPQQQSMKRPRLDSDPESVNALLDSLLYGEEEEPLLTFEEEQQEIEDYFQENPSPNEVEYCPSDFEQGLMMMKFALHSKRMTAC